MRKFFRLARETRAATAVEYGLIVALIFLAILVGVYALASTTITMWNNVNAEVQDA
ncbi:MAG TPA: Flp family type IVb pilin [Allosphingosinicella sp.]|nr:Flp family type IVb pilin [Allosphingosinicella sp.]